MDQDWKERAEALFYVEKKNITEIEALLGISRKTLSVHLSSTDGYREERERRKRENAVGRKEYKREWDRKNRFTGNVINAETIRREHDVAAVILSREKYR